MDQEAFGSEWYLLGTFPFAAGTSGYVELSDDANGTVIADAVRFVNVEGSEIIIDDGDADFELQGEWTCVEGALGAFPPPSVNDKLEFIDESVTDGSLVGAGPGRSAEGRLGALINMIEAAGDLIEAGDIAGACQQLMDAYSRCDSAPIPPEFVEGEAAPSLAQMLQELMDNLRC